MNTPGSRNYLSAVIRGLVAELKYPTGKYKTGFRDSFEWVEQPALRSIYWSIFLRYRLPLAVEFEMNSLCNRRCSYCPVSIAPRPKGYFPFDAFKTIIDELAGMNYRGIITPNFYGEPLLDKRIYQFVDYARKTLPLSTIIINTNADKLDIEAMLALLKAGATYIFISQHDEQPSEPIAKIDKYLESHPVYKRQVVIKNRTAPDQALTNRGGLIDDSRVINMPAFGCFRSRRATITYDGFMILCCEDYNAEYRFGNVIENGLWSVWKNSLKKRKQIYTGNYEDVICKACAGLTSAQSANDSASS